MLLLFHTKQNEHHLHVEVVWLGLPMACNSQSYFPKQPLSGTVEKEEKKKRKKWQKNK